MFLIPYKETLVCSAHSIHVPLIQVYTPSNERHSKLQILLFPRHLQLRSWLPSPPTAALLFFALPTDKQGRALDRQVARYGILNGRIKVALVVALPPLRLGQVLFWTGFHPHHVKSIGQGRLLVFDRQVCRHARQATPLAKGSAAAALVEDGGEDAAVYDAGPTGGATAKIHDADKLACRSVVKDSLIAAHAPRSPESTGSDVLGLVLGGERLVGVPGIPSRVGFQLFDYGEVRRLCVQDRDGVAVFFGVGDWRVGRGDDQAERGAGGGPDEEEDSGRDEASAATGAWLRSCGSGGGWFGGCRGLLRLLPKLL